MALPRLSAGQLTTSAPSALGHHGETPKHPLSAHHCPSCSGWCLTHSTPRAAARTLEFRSNGSLWQSREPFLWGQDHGSSFCVVFCCSPPLIFFSRDDNTPEELSVSFQNFSISLTCSNLHHSSFLVSHCTTALYLCPRTNALVEGMNWNLSIKEQAGIPETDTAAICM